MVCAIYFTPVAGYIPDRPVIKYLAAQRNIEIAFAPVAGTRILVPFRMRIPTPLGTAHAGSHPVRHHGHAAARREDELRLRTHSVDCRSSTRRIRSHLARMRSVVLLVTIAIARI